MGITLSSVANFIESNKFYNDCLDLVKNYNYHYNDNYIKTIKKMPTSELVKFVLESYVESIDIDDSAIYTEFADEIQVANIVIIELMGRVLFDKFIDVFIKSVDGIPDACRFDSMVGFKVDDIFCGIAYDGIAGEEFMDFTWEMTEPSHILNTSYALWYMKFLPEYDEGVLTGSFDKFGKRLKVNLDLD